MYESPADKVVKLLRGRLAIQNGVAMRMTAKAGDHISMSAGLRGRVRQHPAQFRGRLFHQFIGKPDRQFQIDEVFRMAQG